MPITLNGSGTVTGISAGGLPDGVITRPDMGYAGAILQVVSATKTDTFSTSSTSFVDIPGLSVFITPQSANSKVLVWYTAVTSYDLLSSTLMLRLMRDSTAIGIGDAAGNRPRVTSNAYGTEITGATTIEAAFASQTGMFLDSPSSTSALTYKIQGRSSQPAPVYLNRSTSDRDTADYDARTISTITLMEVAG